MPLHRAEREVKLLEIHDLSLKASVSTTGPGGDVLSRFSLLLSDFGSLQAQYGRFQEDFAAFSKDVAALDGRLERMDVLWQKVGDVEDKCQNMQTRMNQADERAVGLEQRVEGLEGDVDNVNGMLEQFAEDHPLAAVIFQFEEDCLQGTSSTGANTLMQEHAARMGTDAGCTSRNSRPRSRASTSASGSVEEGWIIDLPAGEHTLSEMQRRGVSERPSFGAIRVTPGFEAMLFEFSNFGGKMLYLREGDHNLTAGDTAFAKVGAIRLQRLRHSEWALREDVDQIRAQVDAQSNRFTTLRADLVNLVQNQGSESNVRMEKAIGKLEAQTHQLADYCRQYNADIEHLRKTKAEKGENKDLPEQIADLRERFEALTHVVDEGSRKIANKADLSMVLDKVTRDEIQEFVQAIQQLLQIGGPYAYTGHKLASKREFARNNSNRRPKFGDGEKSPNDKTFIAKKGTLNFVPLKSTTHLKVWSNSSLPRQYGGVEPVWVDQSTTALGRGVQFKTAPPPRPQTAPSSRSTPESGGGESLGSPDSKSTSPLAQRRFVDDRQLPRSGPISSPPRVSMGLDERARLR